MARASADERSGLTAAAAANDAGNDRKPRDSGVSDRSSSSRSRQSAMAGRAHPWQELKGGEAGDDMDKKTAGSSDIGVGNMGNSAVAVKRGSTDEVPIEMERIGDAGAGPAALGAVSPGHAAPGRGGSTEVAPEAVGVEYKVYKRRWFGLVQLTLLNIIVSWDVSAFYIGSCCWVESPGASEDPLHAPQRAGHIASWLAPGV